MYWRQLSCSLEREDREVRLAERAQMFVVVTAIACAVLAGRASHLVDRKQQIKWRLSCVGATYLYAFPRAVRTSCERDDNVTLDR